jgi:hypothetical protein
VASVTPVSLGEEAVNDGPAGVRDLSQPLLFLTTRHVGAFLMFVNTNYNQKS